MTKAFDVDRIGGRRMLQALVDAVCEAGEQALALARAGAGTTATRKPDRSPVTAADAAVERRLRAHLDAHHPLIPFLGEETGARDAPDASLRFIVDPIDGTRAFVRGLPTWSILVGLEADGEPALGIALFPVDGDLLVGVRGDGATVNGRRCRVSAVASLDDATVSHGGLHQFTDAGLGGLLARLGARTHAQRGFGDFDGYRQVLSGRVDAMVDPGVKPWDVCPAAVMIHEAGGRFTDFTGAPTIHGGTALASNGLVHDALLALVSG